MMSWIGCTPVPVRELRGLVEHLALEAVRGGAKRPNDSDAKYVRVSGPHVDGGGSGTFPIALETRGLAPGPNRAIAGRLFAQVMAREPALECWSRCASGPMRRLDSPISSTARKVSRCSITVHFWRRTTHRHNEGQPRTGRKAKLPFSLPPCEFRGGNLG